MSLGKSISTARPWQAGFALLVVPLTLIAGCGSSSGNVAAFNTAAPVPPAMQHPRLEGFPIPPGFALVDKKSHVERNGDLRYAHCEFVGGLSITEVDRFYRQTMPKAGYTLRNERLDQGEYLLQFEGPRESSTVSFKANRKKTNLVITLNPVSGGPAAPVSKPNPQP